MDQQHNNNQYDFLWAILANPANNADLDISSLRQLVNNHPQSGILQVLLACYSEEKNLLRAAIYFNSSSLFKLVKTPDALKEVTLKDIKVYNGAPVKALYKENSLVENLIPSGDMDTYETESYFSAPTEELETETVTNNNEEALTEIDKPVDQDKDIINQVDTLAPPDQETEGLPIQNDSQISVFETDAAAVDHDPSIQIDTPNPPDQETEFMGDDAESDDISETQIVPVEGDKNPLTTIDTPAPPDQETEFMGDSAGSEKVTDDYQEHPVTEKENTGEFVDTAITDAWDGLAEPVELEEGLSEEVPPVTEEEAKAPQNQINSESDRLIVGNIAATDYFMFDKAFSDHAKNGKEVNIPLTKENIPFVPPILPLLAAENGTENEEVSKYHDDKMPYTFMWWLDKTRKEHVGIYQPYAAPVKTNDTSNKLEQQYYENIFHINSVDDLEKSAATQTIEFDMKRKDLFVKEHVIIERFLKEEPQIKPQSGDKLGNENKAKKSSEDRDDEMVTETLAVIYTDQMLYHKAIAAYKKLMLKFPEKSVYFAGKIEQLEKKTN